MTAVAAPYDDLFALFSADGGLTDALVEQLEEDVLAALLVRRFRSFLARGYRHTDALLRAVGFAERDLAAAAEAATGRPLVLQ